MRRKVLKMLVTGGSGFIGSEFVRQLVGKGFEPIVVDKLTYAGDLKRLQEVKGKYKFYKADICKVAKLESIFKKEKPKVIVHFAAETHVDRSIKDSAAFIETNIEGTRILLELSRKYKIKKFIHISTDEVYGEIKRGKFKEGSNFSPNSPYAASKAAADLLIKAYIRTYSFPAIIARPCNNYGPWQYPEKLIPLSILKVLKNKKIPIYGKGKNVREWLYVSDCARAIWMITQKGKIGQIYNIGSGQERINIDVAKRLLKSLARPESRIEFVKDRLGHDFRYSLNFKKLKKNLGWKPKITFEKGLNQTVCWSLKNKKWLFDKWNHIIKLYG